MAHFQQNLHLVFRTNTTLKNVFIAFFLLFAFQLQGQIVGPYTGIDYATDYTNPDEGAPCDMTLVNLAIGDADFINGAAEIPMGWSFSGTWNSGATYLDGVGSELLLVSLHTYTESWHVALRLSDGSTTAFADYDLTLVTSNATGTLASCGIIYPGPYNYERPSQLLDFADFAIPPGVGVIGVIFEPYSDGAANPDPHGVIVLEDTPIDPPCDALLTTVSATEICFGEEVTLEAVSENDGIVTWDGGVVDGVPFAPPIGVNTYTATSDFDDDCDFVVDITVYEIPDVTANVDETEICLGESVIFTGVGADTYVWDMGVIDGDEFTPDAVGTFTYTVVGTSVDGCENTASIDVTVNPNPDVTAAVTDIEICLSQSVIFTGGGADSYVWDMGVIDEFEFTPDAIGTETYTVTGTFDATGCENTASIDVTVLSDIPVDALSDDADNEICLGDPIVLSGGGADVYVWDMGVTDGVSFIPPSIGDFTYNVVGSIIGGCTGENSITITVHPLPNVGMTADQKGCSPFATELESANPEVSYSWNFGDGSTGAGSPVAHTYEFAGDYDVTLTVVDVNGCSNSETEPAFIEVVQTPVASFMYSPETSNITDTEIEFANTSLHGTEFEWNFGDGSSVSNEEHPTHTFPIIGNITYAVKLTVTTESLCVDEVTQIIKIEDALFFFIPNAFTPDGDSFNESFKPMFDLGLDVYDYHLVIFNRWGETVFESYNVDYGWDGTYGNGEIVQDGVYTWAIEFGETMSDKKHEVGGHVTVIR